MREERSRYSSVNGDFEGAPSKSKVKEKKVRFWTMWPLWLKILSIVLIVIFSLLLLAFIAIWVIVPIVFMESVAFQRYMMFLPYNDPKNPDFEHPESYGINGTINFYITVKDNATGDLGSIGAWLVIPEDEVATTHTTDVNEIIRNTKKDILFYLHGVGCNRCKPINQYQVFRKFWLVIAIDHRGYGDSAPNVVLTEDGVIDDHLQIYDWLKTKTDNNVYYWGHSLGAALTCHTVRKLKETRDVIPRGVILESAFTTMREEITSMVLGRIFSWLAYFNQTILDPVDWNGFHFYSTTNIQYIDCPILQMHAEDDNVINIKLGRKLNRIANETRKENQGKIIYHEFPAVGYKHVDITKDPKVPEYIQELIDECEDFYNNKTRKLRQRWKEIV